MAGSKHSRFGASEGSGSPLAAQLQQAWLQTQMPKVQKRNFMSLSSLSSQTLRLSPSSGPISEQSALKSLSSIFPELIDTPEEKKPLIFSVFEDGEEPTPMSPDLRQKKADCLHLLFEGIMIGEKPRVQASKSSAIQTRRSISAPLIEQPIEPNVPVTKRSISAPLVGGSLPATDELVGALSSSHSFAGSQQAHFNDSFTDADIWSGLNAAPSSDGSVDLDTERTPLFSYLSEILMDENVDENKCMFMEMSAYQAMARELGDLISDESPSPPMGRSISPEFIHEELDAGRVDTWIEEMLSGPLPAELEYGHGTEKGSGRKFAKGLSEFVTQSDSGSGSSGGDSESGSWENGRDSGSEVAESRVPDLPVAPVTAEDTLYFRHKDSALPNYSLANPVLPSAHGNGVHIPSSSPVPPVDLTNLLIRCAEAVDQSDFRYANELIGELRQHSSAYGNGPQRMAHYFMEALVAKMSGTGGQLYSAVTYRRPSESEMLKGFKLFVENCPYIQIAHSFANHTILDACKGASRVHIVDYGILYGVQWPCLIHMLAQRPEGPPHLRITGIDRPQPGFRPSARIQETGKRLAKLAKLKGVPFEFHAIAEKWEAITPAHLMLREGEVLVVNCTYRLRHVLDESVTAASPREMLLSRIRSLNPKVFVQGLMHAGLNAPFFMSRFREALAHFSSFFDLMEATMLSDSRGRLILDREIFGREILNVVACEGLERVERPETYRHWQSRTSRAGFQQIPIPQLTTNAIKDLMKQYNRNYGIGEDGCWVLLGWKDRITHALGAWEPIPVSP